MFKKLKDELAHRFCETVPRGQDRHMMAVQFGFDFGTKAVIERAQVLVDALENARERHCVLTKDKIWAKF